MIKWIIISAVVIIVSVFVIQIIKVMLKAEKESNKTSETSDTNQSSGSFNAQDAAISTGSSINNIVTDMSEHAKDDYTNTFYDNADSEFKDYSHHAKKNSNHNSIPEDFDFDGERSDEYIPDSPEFSYIPRRQPPEKKPIERELNDLPTEMKVLMLSDIFDKKTFDD